MQELAKKIAIYNGFKGTEKQIEKTIKSFGSSFETMQRYCKERGLI